MATSMHNPAARRFRRPRVVMVQDGARRRYALPAALHRANMLEVMYTDWFVQPGSIEEALGDLVEVCCPARAAQFAGRTCHELAGAPVMTNPLLMLRQAWHSGRGRGGSDYYHWASKQVGDWIRRHGFREANALLGFIRNVDPDLLACARQEGLYTVGDQIIAPAVVEIAQLQQELDRWPNWAGDEDVAQLQSFVDWERRSWDQLDLILCMSDYVRQGVLAQGVPAGRVQLLPYPMDVRPFACPSRTGRPGPVVVGFVGAVNLRKGIPYFIEVARRFDPRLVHFVAVGAASNPDALAAMPGSDRVEFVGKVPRAQVSDWMAKFDLFFFPSTCEGSAGVVMEAMACGLPVVTTPNAGSVVRHEQDGLIVGSGQVDGFAQSVERLVRDGELRHAMGQAARRRAASFNLEWYSRELADLLVDGVSAGS
ncbi:MAG: glycosyltransferase family 4 protein [Phycisphaeraceae bacterium]|nr:glycosyltransferase family 4 protein [Phycisphaeraceae bacterium]